MLFSVWRFGRAFFAYSDCRGEASERGVWESFCVSTYERGWESLWGTASEQESVACPSVVVLVFGWESRIGGCSVCAVVRSNGCLWCRSLGTRIWLHVVKGDASRCPQCEWTGLDWEAYDLPQPAPAHFPQGKHRLVTKCSRRQHGAKIGVAITDLTKEPREPVTKKHKQHTQKGAVKEVAANEAGASTGSSGTGAERHKMHKPRSFCAASRVMLEQLLRNEQDTRTLCGVVYDLHRAKPRPTTKQCYKRVADTGWGLRSSGLGRV